MRYFADCGSLEYKDRFWKESIDFQQLGRDYSVVSSSIITTTLGISCVHYLYTLSIQLHYNLCFFFQETLWTKIFKHSVELGHYDEAFKSILTNTDHNR